MTRRLHLTGYRRGRREPIAAHAARVAKTLAALGAVSAKLTGWRWADVNGGDHPTDDLASVTAALRQRAVEWSLGAAPQVSWEPRFFLGEGEAPWCACAFTVGVALEDFPNLFAPERVELRLALAPDDALASAAGVGAILSTLGASMELTHGHAGTHRFPVGRRSIVSDGAPVGGWMTWLGPGSPTLPPVLPSPLVAYEQPTGTLLAATPEAFDDADPAHRRAARAIEALLRDAAARG